MRVTQNTNFDQVRENVQRSKGRMEKLQMQNSTMKKLNAPSDNPVGAAKVLEVRTDKVNNDQFLTNAKLAESQLSNTDHALGELADLVVRAKEIALGQSSGASSTDETRIGIAEEVSQLYQQAVSVANRRVGDRYLFGGFKTDKPPVSPEGRYAGDRGTQMVEIAKDVFLASNVAGIDAFNTHPDSSADAQLQKGYGARSPASETTATDAELRGAPVEGYVRAKLENVNVFDELQNLRIGLLTGNVDEVRSTLDRFDTMHSHLLANRAKVGSRMAGIDNSEKAIERQNLTNAQLTTTIEDADMAQVVSDMAKEEQVFRSSLSSSQKLLQPTLSDFIK